MGASLKPFGAALAAALLATACEVAAPPQEPSELGRVAYVGGVDVWSARAAGGERSRLTADGEGGAYGEPRWSPDGRWLAALRTVPAEDLPQLVLVDPSTGASRALTASGTGAHGFSWSPDGRRIAFGGIGAGGPSVTVADVSSGEQRIIARGGDPAWSPVDDRIAFTTPAGELDVVDAAGRATRLFEANDAARAAATSAGIAQLAHPTWSRDGTRLAFAAVERGDIHDAVQFILVGDARVRAPLRAYALGATGDLHHLVAPAWSPRANVLAAAAIFTVPHHHFLWLIDPASTELRTLHDSPKHFVDFTWAPDGRTILLSLDEENAWALVPIDGRPLTVVRPGGLWPSWCCLKGSAAVGR